MKLPLTLTLATLLISCAQHVDRALPIFEDDSSLKKVIWDEDNREDVANSGAATPLAESTALFIRNFRLKKDTNGDFLYEARTLKQSYPLCDDEKFLTQNLLGYCSGVLIGPRTVLTAGHCVPEEKYCRESYLTFGHTQDKAQNLKLAAEDVYSCVRVVKLNYNSTRDYAIIQLDRDVTQAQPVKIGHADALKSDEAVLSISYPLGMPLKIDGGSILQNTPGSYYLRARADTFSGSSGSPLFNSHNELVGILVSGTEDFDENEVQRIQEEKKPGACVNVKRCTDSTCMGERYLKVEGIEFP